MEIWRIRSPNRKPVGIKGNKKKMVNKEGILVKLVKSVKVMANKFTFNKSQTMKELAIPSPQQHEQ